MDELKTMLREDFSEHHKQELRKEDKDKSKGDYVEGAAKVQNLTETKDKKSNKQLLD